jgi:hypothetical protein
MIGFSLIYAYFFKDSIAICHVNKIYSKISRNPTKKYQINITKSIPNLR